mgnify:CR=1 FL=1
MRHTRGVVVALVLSTALVGTVVASSPSTRLCGICGVDGPRHPSADGQPSVLENASFGESSLVVELHDNGSSVWTERVTLDRGSADRLATNRTLRGTFVEQTRGTYVINDPSTIETRVDNRTLVARYRVANSAHSGIGGVLLFDQFHDSASAYRVDADRVVIHGPPGTTVVNDPPTGTVQNGSVVYTAGFDDAPTGETYIAFASEDTIVTDYAAGLTMALDIGPTMLSQVAPFAWVLGLIWAAVAIGITASISTGSSRNARSDGSDSDSVEEAPGGPLGLGGLVSAGVGLLVAIPVVVALRIDYSHTFWLALPAAVVLWGSLWTVRTTRQRVVSVVGVAVSPTFLLLPITPVSGWAGLLLGFGFLIALAWALVIVVFHVIGRYLRNHPAIKW